MFQFIVQKLVHKKWMNFCLFIGFFILICIASCNPMYQRSALEKMLQSDFALEESEQSAYPGTVSVSFYKKTSNAKEIGSKVFKDSDKVQEKLEQLFPEETLYTVHCSSMSYANVQANLSPDNLKLTKRIICSRMSDLEKHVNLIKGEMYSETSADGILDGIVSRAFLDTKGIVLGEELTMTTFSLASGGTIKIRVAGVFEAKDKTDPYWTVSPEEYTENVFISNLAFDALLADENVGQGAVYENYYHIIDTSKLRIKDVSSLNRSIQALKKENGTDSDVTATVNLTPVIKKYKNNEKKVTTTMSILQAPVFLLLLAFIYMVSKQMLEMEKGEIAMMKSRGASRFQIIFSYLGQSAFLAAISFMLGIPGGYLLCKVLGSANAFLEFVDRKTMFVTVNGTSILFGFVAALAAIAFTTLPVLQHAKVGIVEQKQQSGNNQPPVWKKFYLDVLLFLLSCYAYYNFSHQRESLIKKVANGEGIDPLLYICSSLFILGAGFIALRLVPLCIKLIFKIGKKHWNCSLYSSFLQIIRTSNRQLFISIFLVLTVATGIFGANTARTINQNQEDRIQYDNGADIIMKETWKNNRAEALHDRIEKKIVTPVVYEEPDIQRYETLKDIKSMAKVIREENAMFFFGDVQYNASMIGINTKEFGQTAWMKDGVLDKHWFHYLNDLAKTPNGALVSSNLKKEQNAKIGDTVVLTRMNEIDDDLGAMQVVICGFIDAFPGYDKEDGKYFFVTNYSDVVNSYGLTPYELWIKSEDTNGYIYDFINKENIRLSKFQDTKNDLIRGKNEPVFQITNGLLTLSFVVILVLCMIGFLIYWILSIRQRELLFGIYRAMGMSMKEVYSMLINEHIFSSIVSIAVGVVVGIISSNMFIPLILLTYMPKDHCLPIDIITKAGDMVRLGVSIGFMLIICLFVIGTILKKMKVTQVLKLGEE